MLALAFLLVSALPAAAQVITYTSVNAEWRDAQDTNGASAPDPIIDNVSDPIRVSWGTTTGTQSSYTVEISIPPDPTDPPAAEFIHNNFTVNQPWLTSVVLDIEVEFDVEFEGTTTSFGPMIFTYTLDHDETPNGGSCPYPTTGPGCSDAVTITQAPTPTTFTVGGKVYTLGMTFLDASGDPVDQFITQEGGVANSTDLDVQFTLVPPEFEVTKSGPATLAAGQAGVFTIDAQNVGPNDAWHITITDLLPDGATGGLCDATPEVLSAGVYEANGTTAVGPALTEGTDFTLSHAGAPTCELILTMLTADSVVGENERLIIEYQTQLDAGSQFGVSLTNVAGATEWFDAEANDPTRGSYAEVLGNGTPGTVDHEDAHTVDTGPLDYLFEKTVVDPVSGTPVTIAVTGDTLRYRVRIANETTTPLVGLGVTDVVDDLNGSPLFVPGSLTLVTWPAGSDISATNPLGGSGTGIVDVRDISVAPNSSEFVEFDLTLTTPIAEGTLVTNQATLLAAGAPFVLSDDPNVNGPSDPNDAGDNDPTVVTIVSAPSFITEKTWADLTGDPLALRPGDTLRYTITAKNVGTDDAVDAELRDALPANTTYVAGSTTLNGSPVPDGPGSTLPLAGGMLINAPEDLTPGAMRADVSATPANVATIRFDVVVDLAAVDGTVISNQAFVSAVAGFVDQPSDDPTTPLANDPTLVAVSASPPDPLVKDITQPSAAVGEAFSYRITIPQIPHAYALYDVQILDDLTASAADLRFLSVSRVSGTTVWTPVNTGSPTNLVIEDTTTGIDIPAGDQIVLEISVVLEDTTDNTTGLVFANTAEYTHNWIDDDQATAVFGVAGISPDMTIEAPVLVMQKSGPPGLPATSTAVYTLDVQNVGAASAWNPTLLDQVANPTPGGMCDVPPAAITAQIFEANGSTQVGPALVEGTDFTATFAPDPTCELTIAFTEPSISIAPTQRLIVTYALQLDADTADNTTLINVAGAVEWFTADGSIPETAGDRRTVTETLTNGTVGTPDHEDAHSLVTMVPLVRFQKTVEDASAPAGPITQANPGDRLRYTIEIENVGTEPLIDFTFSDELDRLNVAQPGFEPNTIGNVAVSIGSSATNIDGQGGSAGTGTIEVTGLDLPNNGDVATIVFEIDVAPALPSGLVVQNQAEISIGGVSFWMSDDPNVLPPADPTVVGDEDATAFTIVSAPSFLIEKTSADLTGDPAVLRAGDTLSYTMTVENVGDEDAIDVSIRDAVPVNTTYVAGSTLLNGSPVVDGPSGTLPLAGGMLIYAPANTTPGTMLANASATPDNVATISFQVVVSSTAPDGTVISNQAFVTSVGSGVIDAPSDDPGTTIPDDPTRDVVGDLPLLFSSKDAVLSNDVSGNGVADPGDTLQYTIQVFNNGAVAATGVTLQDAVPANSAYLADTLTLNGAGVGQPDGGVSPLVAGIDISSADLPAPAPGAGTISPGQSATVVFEVDVLAGPQVVNQAQVASNEGGVLLTDGDGDPTTGPEPTVVFVGAMEQVAITKQVSVVGGGAALPGSVLEYVVRVSNVGNVPATGVEITDDLNLPLAGQLVYVNGSATLQAAAGGVTYDGVGLLTADYGGTYGPLPVGADAVLRFQATLAAGLSIGDLVQNDAIVTWGAPAQNDTGSVTVTVGGMPGLATLSGTLWHDVDFDGAIDGGEPLLAGWLVDLYRNGLLALTVAADANGVWSMSGLAPNDVSGVPIELRFRAPDAGPASASLGTPVSPFTNGPQQIQAVVLSAGSLLAGLDLPITPNGVVYSSLLRIDVAGATLQLLDAGTGTPVAPACFTDPQQQGQQTRGDGRYKFDLVFGDPSCLPGGDYLIDVAPPATGYVAGPSTLIPPVTDAATAAFDTPSCGSGPDDAVPATVNHCEVQASALAPAVSVPAGSAGTNHYLHLTFNALLGDPSAQIFNNHIALDPDGANILGLSKTTPKLNVSVGELVPYEIVVSNPLSTALTDVTVVDRFPAGFRYIEGSARIDGVEQEPVRVGRELTWTGLTVAARTQQTIVLLLAVGAGVTEGEFTNTAEAIDGPSGIPISSAAAATVRVVADPDFDCTDVLGKVFDDRNLDGQQDAGEQGLSGVRLLTPRGLQATTDAHGRFHITCAIVPHERRGSNFVLKLDDRSLPAGHRLTTPVTQVKRATRGKALRFRFGATIHRVVGLDVADSVFEPNGTDLRVHWQPRIDLLLEQLRAEPSLLRLTYTAEKEGRDLVEARLRSLEKTIARGWRAEGNHEPRIEREIDWTRGAPDSKSRVAAIAGRVGAAFTDPFTRDDDFEELDAPSRSEQSLRPDGPLTLWAVDPETASAVGGDTLEVREVLTDAYETKKMRNVVPPIRFDAGSIEIDPSTIDAVRQVLGGMKHLHNVRLHLVGHADNMPLSGTLARRYDDNFGLSRERAGEVAELVKAALGLSPESISFDGLGESEPVASNDTEAGRRRNRRVEVEVWYDVPVKKRGFADVVISDDMARVKVCRTQTLCKMRFQAGHERRTRIRNVIAPLQLGEQTVSVPDAFVREIEQALAELQDERNVTVKFIGYSDDAPLSERAERIYGSQLALSKARARRVALAVKDALRLPSDAVASEGRGNTRPVASNATENGRSLNRRVEVEIWHDDPLQELPDDPRLCPDDGGRELITHIYDPSWGRIAPIPIEDGQPLITSELPTQLARAFGEIADRPGARLRFVGYVRNERLDRRTALAYGDDIGLSTARARRTMERVQETLGLDDTQVEFEGRGFLHSNDVVNGGFVKGDTSEVRVEVVYDELARADSLDGIDVTPISMTLEPQHPLSLNLMRITVNGEPIDDPARSSADLQRCTDVALDDADVRFHFDERDVTPRLAVASEPMTVRVHGAGVGFGVLDPRRAPPSDVSGHTDAAGAASVRFRTYTNYAHYVDRMEVRLFDQAASVRGEPVAVVPVGPDGTATWSPPLDWFASPMREMKFVLRAYDDEDRFDETRPQPLWLVHGGAEASASADGAPPVTPGSGVLLADPSGEPTTVWPADRGLYAGYGEAWPVLRNIPFGNSGTVRVVGHGIGEDQRVALAGRPVAVDDEGRFVAEQILPTGQHTVEVAVEDEGGGAHLFLRDLELDRNDWFFVGMADVTVGGARTTSGDPGLVDGTNPDHDLDSNADGRFAFFLNGTFGDDWQLTASADTREGAIGDIFRDFLHTDPDSLFRRIEPEDHYPTFGDDGTVQELAPTQGRMYARLSKEQSHLLWGNFRADYLDNELAQLQRGLYGGNLRWESSSTTRYGEKRFSIDGFAADPGTLTTRESMRGTGGSLYYLRRSDLTIGSEFLRIEVRDKVSGLVKSVVDLRPGIDYDIDYLQGRVLLSEPLASTVDDDLLVRTGGRSGDEVWLVTQYEYAPGFSDVDGLAAGGQGHFWLGDFLRIGAMASHDEGGDDDTNLFGADLTLRATAGSWLKLQYGRSEGRVAATYRSDDGGFEFVEGADPTLAESDANAYRADLAADLSDLVPRLPGRLTAYGQQLDGGYSAPGLSTSTDTLQAGGTFHWQLLDVAAFEVKADWLREEQGLETSTQEVDVTVQLTESWAVKTGVRNDVRDDESAAPVATQEEGRRTDGVLEVEFDSQSTWTAHAFGQGTLSSTGNREDNVRYGAGAEIRLTDKLSLDGDVSHGDGGIGAHVGTSYQLTRDGSIYTTYALENERSAAGSMRRGNLVSGARSRFSDSGSVFAENRYTHSRQDRGLVRAAGMDMKFFDRWTVAANVEVGTLKDRQTAAETERYAAGGNVGYAFGDVDVYAGVEYRYDDIEQSDGSRSDRKTWLFKGAARARVHPDWRLLTNFAHSFSDSSEGSYFDGGFTEAVGGFAYRPVGHDRLDVLAKYTYFFNRPTTDQVTGTGEATEYLQRSHVGAIDVSYDLTDAISVGGKYAYRRGELSLDRVTETWFSNDAHLGILRTDYRFFSKWEALAEGRVLYLPDLDERKSGALIGLFRYFGKNLKVGVGYNFTDFSEDLTDLSYDHHGLFFNIIGTF